LRTQAEFPPLSQTFIDRTKNVAVAEASASWSNYSVVETCEHANSTLFSTHLQLTSGGVEPEEPGRYGPGNPKLMVPEDPGAKAASPRAMLLKMPAPTISEIAMPYGTPPASGTSIANVTADRQRMTLTNKVWLM
jgi:hypothetical protein